MPPLPFIPRNATCHSDPEPLNDICHSDPEQSGGGGICFPPPHPHYSRSETLSKVHPSHTSPEENPQILWKTQEEERLKRKAELEKVVGEIATSPSSDVEERPFQGRVSWIL